MAASLGVVAQVSVRPDNELEPIEFALDNVHYRILVPRRSRLSQTSSPSCVTIRDPSARSMTFLELCSASGARQGPFPSRATLTNGARVRYSVDSDIGGGSGGTEGELKGRLDLDGTAFDLTCRDQGELGNDPSWCLHYLGYLEVKRGK